MILICLAIFIYLNHSYAAQTVINSINELCGVFSKKGMSKILVIGAHPDDIETAAGGTIAAMTYNCSISVFYVITTNGDKGWSKDFNMTSSSLAIIRAVSYTHLRAHETGRNLVCRLLLEKKN